MPLYPDKADIEGCVVRLWCRAGCGSRDGKGETARSGKGIELESFESVDMRPDTVLRHTNTVRKRATGETFGTATDDVAWRRFNVRKPPDLTFPFQRLRLALEAYELQVLQLH